MSWERDVPGWEHKAMRGERALRAIPMAHLHNPKRIGQVACSGQYRPLGATATHPSQL